MTRYVLVALLGLAGCKPDAHAAREELASKESSKRESAAKTLRKMNAANPLSVGDHGEAYWVDRLTKLQNARTASERTALMEGIRDRGALEGPYMSVLDLDDFWGTSIGWRPDGSVHSFSPPSRNVMHVDVEPPNAFTGTWTTYYINGATYSAVDLAAGVRRRSRDFYDNGQLRREYRFIDGKVDGVVVTHFPNGAIERTEPYVKGMKQGVEKSFFPSGKLQAEWTLVNDTYEGRTAVYTEEGSRSSCDEYHASVRVGPCAAP